MNMADKVSAFHYAGHPGAQTRHTGCFIEWIYTAIVKKDIEP